MIKKNYSVNFLTVINDEKVVVNNKNHYLCLCKCGNEKLIKEDSLRTKRIRDCGCGNFMTQKYIGNIYGNLKVVECYRKRLQGRVNIIAKCLCKCGNYKDIPISELNKGKQVSCGCIYKFNFNDNYCGKTFNNIEILNVYKKNKKNVALCKCHCGNKFECNLYDLTSNKRYIVGCSKCNNDKGLKWNEVSYRNKLRSVWYNIVKRCNDTTDKDYKYYGQRGIKVCKDWENSFDSFYNWAIQKGYKENLTVDRIDFNNDYSPENCRLVDWETQQNNRRNNVKYYINGEFLSIKQISQKYNINSNTFRSRINIGKMTVEEAVLIPVKKRR